MARCLVIGGNGFLGSYLVDELAARGHEVTVFDRFSSGDLSYTAAGVTAVAGDFMDAAALESALAGQQLVFHFLSSTTPASADSDPALDVRTNVAQGIVLFDLAVAAGVERVYFASTGGAMYGHQDGDLISEQALPAPVSPYALGKQAIEGYLRYYERKHGLASVSFRISNPYGARQRPTKRQGVIPIFLHHIEEGTALPVYGDGSMVRDYIYAADAARMIADTVGRDPKFPVYNIGSGVGTTISEVVALAAEVTGREPLIERLDAPPTFVDRVVLDTTRFTAEFGGAAPVSLREGMRLTWLEART